MKFERMLLAAGLAASLIFAGCANAPKVAGDFQAQVAKACAVVQPTLLSVQAMTVNDPAQQVIIGQVVKLNGSVCAANASVDPSNVSALVNTSIPAAVQVIALLPIDEAAKSGAQIGLMAFQVALSAALAQYGTPTTAAPAPASGVATQ
jgi:outer membrane murein-binding lipoprotein Lpp